MLYFCFDAETDGLYGEAFAIAAVVMDGHGELIDLFSKKCIAPGVFDEWTRKNCLPYLDDMENCKSRNLLISEFWDFYIKWKDRCISVADVPCPVEANLLRTCVKIDEPDRRFMAPFPLIDVASVLYAKGIDPLIDRLEFSGHNGDKHNPIDDAIASVKCLLKAMSM